jgi:5'-phosphate synthase pdxT subunit
MVGMKIGILGLQGDFDAHARMLEKISVTGVIIKKAASLGTVDGLIIPGGESSTILKLMAKDGFVRAFHGLHERDIPVYGTCAGVILLARQILNDHQESLGLLDVDVVRNAYGRQIDSFETEAVIECLGDAIKLVFIRAPVIRRTGPGVEVLACYGGHPVMVRQGNILGTTFHPEMTEDTRIHEYFIRMVENKKS